VHLELTYPCSEPPFVALFVVKLFYQRFSAFSFPRVTYVSYLNTAIALIYKPGYAVPQVNMSAKVVTMPHIK